MTYLSKILAAHRAAAAEDQRSLDALVEQAGSVAPTRGFAAALRRTEGVAVISEIKRRSPSKGALNPDLDPAEWAGSYAAGGASCLSVLTDVEFFGGSGEDLATARAACELPVIRKDFTVSANDVADARIMGADAVLLIAAALRMGALAAGCALALHSTGVLVRLYTETADDWASPQLRRGPGFGTSWLVYRVGPGGRGTLLTHTTLQAEANLRAAFALGIVGAGGLGDAFHTAISYWQLERASTLALAMVVLFVVLDRLARRASGGENPSTAARGSSSVVP